MTETPPPPPSDPNRPAEGTPPPPPPPGGFEQQPQPGYGQPPQAGYGQPPQPGYGQPPQGYGAPATGGAAYADWPLRVGSALIDYVAPFLVAGILFFISDVLGWLAYLAALGWAIYQSYLGGQTGQSLGKQTMKTRLIAERTGQPIGGGLGIGRYFLHIVDGLPCYLGYLWPLWDAKKQTFSDKILSTIVVKV